MEVGQKAIVIENTEGAHYFEVGTIVQFIELSNDDYYLFEGHSKNHGFMIEQLLDVNEFAWV